MTTTTKAINYLRAGMLPADKNNLVIFLKVCTFVAVIACTAFASGYVAGNTGGHHMGIRDLENQILHLREEQQRRAPLVYR